jgi:hypothetical protein
MHRVIWWEWVLEDFTYGGQTNACLSLNATLAYILNEYSAADLLPLFAVFVHRGYFANLALIGGYLLCMVDKAVFDYRPYIIHHTSQAACRSV